jgi:hypothetical protein
MAAEATANILRLCDRNSIAARSRQLSESIRSVLKCVVFGPLASLPLDSSNFPLNPSVVANTVLTMKLKKTAPPDEG